MHHINIIAMRNIIILKKVREKEKLLKDTTDIIIFKEVTWALNSVDLT